MTSQKSYSESRSPGLFAAKYFNFSLMRSWPHLVFYFVVFLFTIPVPLMSGLRNVRFYMYNNVYEMSVNAYTSVSMAVMFVSAFAGIFSGMTTMNYVNSKVSINFYHSLPLRREGHFITSVLVRYVNYILPLLLNILLGAAVSGVMTGNIPLYFSTIFGSYFGYALLFYSIIYFITLFAGMISGLGAVRFVLTLWILAAPFCVYAGVISSIGYFSSTFYTNYYFTPINILHLSPVIRMVNLESYPMSTAEVIVYIIAAAVIAFLSCLLYLKRKSERSGDTVVYKTAGSIIKYVSMFLITLYTGMLFASFNSYRGDTFWLLFGFICGSILSFMLVNTILHKNPRMMFKGMKGFAVFAACFTAFFAVAGYDIFDFDSKLPPISMVSEIKVSTDNDLIFKDSGDIEFILEQLDQYQFAARDPKNTVYYAEDTTVKVSNKDETNQQYVDILNRVIHNYGLSTETNVYAYIKLPFGITLAKNYLINADFVLDLYKFIVESDELDEYLKNVEINEDGYTYVNLDYVNQDGLLTSWGYSESINNMRSREEMIENGRLPSSYAVQIKADDYIKMVEAALKPVRNGVSQETFNKYKVGAVGVNNSTIPVFSDNTEFLELAKKAVKAEGYSIDSAADNIQVFADSITDLVIYDKKTSELIVYTDRDQIKQIVENMKPISTYMLDNTYTIYEPRYRILYSIYGESDTSEKNGYGYFSQAVFREGMVPDFIN